MTRFTTPRGNRVEMTCREGTNDAMVCAAVIAEDEYRVRGLPLEGTALDIGAHIGAFTVMAATDWPELRVIAVEPVPDNAALLLRNVEANGLSERVTVIEGALGSGPQRVGWNFRVDKPAGEFRSLPPQVKSEYRHAAATAEMHRYIGNQRMPDQTKADALTVPGFTLSKLVTMAGGSVSIIKIDCEGCERNLRGKALQHVERIHGEVHYGPSARVIVGKDEFLAALQ